jgi:hypothetical protein
MQNPADASLAWSWLTKSTKPQVERPVKGLLLRHYGRLPVRNNAFIRGEVSSLLTSALRDAGGRELRGLAWRMGAAPTG